ncbi:hypothetical protein L249_7018 [Ophiocordyceps polyrhachis-furcata BCC 54312]|uniref:Uncharacterized protein n=1 Tax=Ophiocordyceps polyrhachis-furcata BCC 54312 TaxID=1330021 RepID=A0A367LL77_9HYPO|nr:hypothetical protein L249_7018 [Ophiocordyceps polyrhachis-furcata BCC 54312]
MLMRAAATRRRSEESSVVYILERQASTLDNVYSRRQQPRPREMLDIVSRKPPNETGSYKQNDQDSSLSISGVKHSLDLMPSVCVVLGGGGEKCAMPNGEPDEQKGHLAILELLATRISRPNIGCNGQNSDTSRLSSVHIIPRRDGMVNIPIDLDFIPSLYIGKHVFLSLLRAQSSHGVYVFFFSPSPVDLPTDVWALLTCPWAAPQLNKFGYDEDGCVVFVKAHLINLKWENHVFEYYLMHIMADYQI